MAFHPADTLRSYSAYIAETSGTGGAWCFLVVLKKTLLPRAQSPAAISSPGSSQVARSLIHDTYERRTMIPITLAARQRPSYLLPIPLTATPHPSSQRSQ